ncbi:MAG: ligase, partial [Nostocoides sp.]
MGLSAKQQIRAQRRAARRAIVGARNLAEDGERIAEHLQPLLDHLEIGAGDCVPAYEALPLEPRIDEVCRVLTARGARVLVPLTLASFDLDWADAADPERTALGVAALADA